MSIQRDVEIGSALSETKAAKVARLAQVLSRGVISTKFNPVNLPDNMVGQWMPDDPNENTRMELLGFKDGSDYVANPTNKSGTGVARIGDVRYWVTDKEQHAAIKEAEEQLKDQRHGNKTRQWEENNLLSEDAGPDIGKMTESKVEEADANHIAAATARPIS